MLSLLSCVLLGKSLPRLSLVVCTMGISRPSMKYEDGWEGLVHCGGVHSCQRLHCCHLTLCPASQSSVPLDRFGRKLGLFSRLELPQPHALGPGEGSCDLERGGKYWGAGHPVRSLCLKGRLRTFSKPFPDKMSCSKTQEWSPGSFVQVAPRHSKDTDNWL